MDLNLRRQKLKYLSLVVLPVVLLECALVSGQASGSGAPPIIDDELEWTRFEWQGYFQSSIPCDMINNNFASRNNETSSLQRRDSDDGNNGEGEDDGGLSISTCNWKVTERRINRSPVSGEFDGVISQVDLSGRYLVNGAVLITRGQWIGITVFVQGLLDTSAQLNLLAITGGTGDDALVGIRGNAKLISDPLITHPIDDFVIFHPVILIDAQIGRRPEQLSPPVN